MAAQSRAAKSATTASAAKPAKRGRSPSVAAASRSTLSNKSGTPVVAVAAPVVTVPVQPTLVASWIQYWLIVSIIVVLWDALFVLLRPHSFYPTGSLGWIWAPYAKYSQVDLLYGPAYYQKYLDGQEGWNVTQAIMNVTEIAVALLFFLYNSIGQRGAALLALVSCTMTASKTIAYMLIDHNEGWSHTKHNTDFDFWVTYVLPSSFWIVFPILSMASIISAVWDQL